MTLPVGDNFNRADTSPIGGNWSTVAGLASTALVSNASTASSNASDSVSYWNAETFPNNQYSKATIAVIVGSADIGITARCATNFYLSIARSTGTQLYKYTGGGFSTLAFYTHAAYENGDVIGIECEGTTIRSLKNGISQGSTTDSAVTSGAPGVYHWLSTASLDNWEGGSLLGNVSKRYNNKTRNLRSNVLRSGELGWRESVYRNPYPQATNPSTVIPPETTVALTGVSSTTALGTISPALSVALTGVSSTTAVGTLTASTGLTVALTGVSSTATLGTLSPAYSIPLSGSQLTGYLGSISIVGWRAIITTQTPNWVDIITTQTPNWVDI